MSGRRVLAFLIARPLIAVAIAALAVGVLLLRDTHKQTTPVTARTQHVALSDAQQTQLGDQQYAKTLREDRANIISSGPEYREVRRVAARIEAVAGRDGQRVRQREQSFIAHKRAVTRRSLSLRAAPAIGVRTAAIRPRR